MFAPPVGRRPREGMFWAPKSGCLTAQVMGIHMFLNFFLQPYGMIVYIGSFLDEHSAYDDALVDV